jgi:cell division protein FtsZ
MTMDAVADGENVPAEDADEGGRGGQTDELLLDADRLAEADQPVQQGSRRARMLGGSEQAEGAAGEPAPAPAPAPAPKSSAGSTLFERMANLSRAASDGSEDGEDGEEDGGSLRIPRFLGRQNNQ